MKDIFDQEVTNETLARIDKLNADSAPTWGKMSVDQMLAHCCVTYEMVYTDKHPKAKGLKKWMLTAFVKKAVVSEKPYAQNGRTAPAFLIRGSRDFETEKKRLTDYVIRAQKDGRSHFDGLESNSFGNLRADEWNNLFYKHLNHHLTQFGV